MLRVQAVVFSEGALTLDDCDFSASSAPVLVYTEGPNATAIVRNAMLGDENCESITDRHKRQSGGSRLLLNPLYFASVVRSRLEFILPAFLMRP